MVAKLLRLAFLYLPQGERAIFNPPSLKGSKGYALRALAPLPLYIPPPNKKGGGGGLGERVLSKGIGPPWAHPPNEIREVTPPGREHPQGTPPGNTPRVPPRVPPRGGVPHFIRGG